MPNQQSHKEHSSTPQSSSRMASVLGGLFAVGYRIAVLMLLSYIALIGTKIVNEPVEVTGRDGGSLTVSGSVEMEFSRSARGRGRSAAALDVYVVNDPMNVWIEN